MGWWSDLKILYHLALKPVRGKDHAARLENFYSGQAEAYDDFRKRLLKGRQEMYSALPVPENGLWIDMGGGTGANLEYIGEKLPRIASHAPTGATARASPRTTCESAVNRLVYE